MRTHRFTARIGHGVSIAEDVTYHELVDSVLEFAVRAAVARANDQSTWEEDELRRRGLMVIEFAKDGKALWWDRDAFDVEHDEAKRERAKELFCSRNEFDGTFLDTLDEDLRKRLRGVGYATASLLANMNELYREIAAEASDRSAQARESLIAEILNA